MPEYRQIGGRHGHPDLTIVLVPDSAVALLGDCYYPPPAHLRGSDDALDLTMVGGLVSDEYERYVDSHSEPWTMEQARSHEA